MESSQNSRLHNRVYRMASDENVRYIASSVGVNCTKSPSTILYIIVHDRIITNATTTTNATCDLSGDQTGWRSNLIQADLIFNSW